MDDIKTFVLLKYKIITYEKSTWHLCDSYPKEVQIRWAWRCAGDAEHLAEGHKEAEECVRIAKLYKDKKATSSELLESWSLIKGLPPNTYYLCIAVYAIITTSYVASVYASAASVSWENNGINSINHEEKWNLYIEWLIEELCGYEKNHE